MKKYFAVIVHFVLLATGCVSHQMSPHLDYVGEPGFTSPTPDGDSTVVVFLRPDDVRVFSASILDGEKFIAILTEQKHFVYTTTPGDHRFMAHVTRHGPSFVDAELAAGKIYFIAVKYLESGIRVWLQLIPITPDGEYWSELSEWLSQSQLVRPNDSAQRWFEENRVELLSEQENRNTDRISQLTANQGVDHAP